MHNALTRVLIQNEHSSYVIKHILKQNKKWGSKDRYFFAQFVYSSFRYLRRLGLSLGFVWNDKCFFNDLDQNKINKLLIACFVINDHFLIAEDKKDKDISWHWILKNKSFANTLSSNTDYQSIIQKWQAVSLRKEIYSVSDSLDKVAYNELGEKWTSLLQELDKKANVYLRVNSSKIDTDTLLIKLEQENIKAKKETTDLVKNCISLTKRQNINLSTCFKKALFEIQDINSQAVVPFLNVKSGQYIIDACAGAGGKSLHIADLLQAKGKVLALDVVKKKLDILDHRAKKAGFCKLITSQLLTENTKTIITKKADGILLDVPCSGLGVLKRHPESKWLFKESNLINLQQKQLSLLKKYSPYLKTGGTLVYATCSILPSENQEIIKQFLFTENKNFVNWKILKTCVLYPGGGDGFFICSLSKMT